MPRVLACIDYDRDTETCHTQAWVEQGGIADMLPTMEQANVVGFGFLGSLFLIAAAVRTFKPQR